MYVAKYTNPKCIRFLFRCASSSTELTEVDHELGNLETRDPFLPPNPDAACALEIVPVHDDVHKQVESNWHPGDGCETNQLGIT